MESNNNSHNKLNWTDVITEHFKTFHKQTEYDSEFMPFLERHLFFITTCFRRGKVGITDRYIKGRTPDEDVLIPSAIRQFGQFQFAINRYLFGSHLGRKIDRQPRTWAFLDWEGTRSNRTLLGAERKNIHIASLSLIHPATAEKFQQVQFFPEAFKTEWMDKVEVQRFDPKKGSITDLIEYVSKGHRLTPIWDQDRSDLWQVFPALINSTRRLQPHPKQRKK